MTNVTMKAIDTLHISEVSAHSILAGQEFVVSSTTAKELEDSGRAVRVGDAPEAPAEKAEPALENKAEAPLSNKGVTKKR